MSPAEYGAWRKQPSYYLKPMNCPMHSLIYRAARHGPTASCRCGSSSSATVYRYEKSGVVHGLTRVRGFTMDDAHIYCTPEQARPSSSTC